MLAASVVPPRESPICFTLICVCLQALLSLDPFPEIIGEEGLINLSLWMQCLGTRPTSVSRVTGKILIALPQTGSKINFCGDPPLYPSL